jgi:hypothetical protein
MANNLPWAIPGLSHRQGVAGRKRRAMSSPVCQQISRSTQHGITGTENDCRSEEIILRRPDDKLLVVVHIGQESLELDEVGEILDPDDTGDLSDGSHIVDAQRRMRLGIIVEDHRHSALGRQLLEVLDDQADCHRVAVGRRRQDDVGAGRAGLVNLSKRSRQALVAHPDDDRHAPVDMTDDLLHDLAAGLVGQGGPFAHPPEREGGGRPFAKDMVDQAVKTASVERAAVVERRRQRHRHSGQPFQKLPIFFVADHHASPSGFLGGP